MKICIPYLFLTNEHEEQIKILMIPLDPFNQTFGYTNPPH